MKHSNGSIPLHKKRGSYMAISYNGSTPDFDSGGKGSTPFVATIKTN